MSLTHLCSSTNCNSLETPPRRGFRYEADLVYHFSEFLKKKSTYTVTHEIESCNGIADLVLCPSIKNSITSISKIQGTWAFILHQLPYRKKFNTDLVCQLTGYSPTYAKRLLCEATEAGYIRIANENNHWIKTHQPRTVANEFIAIEAKLRNWKKALIQAKRYKLFAHTSWVLLDAAHAKQAILNQDLFVKNNIGLAIFSDQKEFIVITAPTKQRPKSEPSFWEINVEIAKNLTQDR